MLRLPQRQHFVTALLDPVQPHGASVRGCPPLLSALASGLRRKAPLPTAQRRPPCSFSNQIVGKAMTAKSVDNGCPTHCQFPFAASILNRIPHTLKMLSIQKGDKAGLNPVTHLNQPCQLCWRAFAAKSQLTCL